VDHIGASQRYAIQSDVMRRSTLKRPPRIVSSRAFRVTRNSARCRAFGYFRTGPNLPTRQRRSWPCQARVRRHGGDAPPMPTWNKKRATAGGEKRDRCEQHQPLACLTPAVEGRPRRQVRRTRRCRPPSGTPLRRSTGIARYVPNRLRRRRHRLVACRRVFPPRLREPHRDADAGTNRNSTVSSTTAQLACSRYRPANRQNRREADAHLFR
jgi:hypothetical protein